MKRLASFISLFAILTCAVSAATEAVLDDFGSGDASGGLIGGASWTGNIDQDTTGISIINSAKNDSGWGANFAATDFSSWSYLALTASVDAGNLAPSVSIGFQDDFGGSQAFTILTSQFTNTLSTVYIPLNWTTAVPVVLTGWNIGGGAPPPGSVTFRMTFDRLVLTASAVPEPSAYALLAGVACLGFMLTRRRFVKA